MFGIQATHLGFIVGLNPQCSCFGAKQQATIIVNRSIQKKLQQTNVPHSESFSMLSHMIKSDQIHVHHDADS
jgi:hypothetical protein